MPAAPIPMPLRVILVLVLLGLFGLGQLAMMLTYGAEPGLVVQFVVSVTFLVFLGRGHPLARQWAMYVACILLLMGVPTALAFQGLGEPSAMLLWRLAIFVVPAVAILWGLSGRTARTYFDLHCGHCGSFRVRARSLLYNRIRCRSCGREWRVHSDRVDPDVFE